MTSPTEGAVDATTLENTPAVDAAQAGAEPAPIPLPRLLPPVVIGVEDVAPLPRLLPPVVIGVEDVAPEALADSPFQPREVYDPAHIRRLADSMEDIGWLGTVRARWRVPEVRDVVGEDGQRHLELIFGHCRKRAAQLAPLDTIKVEIVEASDEQVLQMIAHENLDRRNLHPLDEGNLFASWLKLGRELEQVVDRSGCSLQFVRTRLRLLTLVDEAKRAFRADAITLGHAKQLAGLQPADQQAALSWLGREQQTERRQPSAAELEAHITARVLLTLNKAPWELHDAGLLPKAGACSTCPKRSGATPELFPGASDADRCADPTCYGEKRAAFLERQATRATELAAKAAEGQPDAPTFALKLSTDYASYGNAGTLGKKITDGKPLARDVWKPVSARQRAECAAPRAAYVDHGPEDLGRVLDVCVSGSGCQLHWPEEETSSPEAKEAKKKEREAERLAAEVRRLTILGVGARAAVDGLTDDDWRCVARALWAAVEPDVRKAWAELHGLEVKTIGDAFIKLIAKHKAEELDAILLQVALVQDTLRGGKELAGCAKRAGVSEKDVLATARENLAPATKPAKAKEGAKAEKGAKAKEPAKDPPAAPPPAPGKPPKGKAKGKKKGGTK